MSEILSDYSKLIQKLALAFLSPISTTRNIFARFYPPLSSLLPPRPPHRRRVPRRVRAGRVRHAQSAVRKRGAVRLAREQLGAAEIDDRLHRLVVEVDEVVVLLGARAAHGREPVRERGAALLHRPLRDRARERVAVDCWCACLRGPTGGARGEV